MIITKITLEGSLKEKKGEYRKKEMVFLYLFMCVCCVYVRFYTLMYK